MDPIRSKHLTRALKPVRWFRLNKLKTSCYSFSLLVGAYLVLCTLVSCAVSPTEQQVTLEDGRVLAYNTHQGSSEIGPQVVLLHGAPADASSWNRLLKRSDEIHAAELLVVDRLGYGNSSDKDELTLAGHAKAISALLEHVGETRPIVVGHSYGGPVALRFAVDYPDRVGGLVLVAGACDAYMNDAQWFRRAVDGIRVAVPKPWERSNRELLALTDENRAMESLLDQVTCPVVIVHGTWDAVCPHDSTIAYLQERLVNAESVTVVSLQRARHNLQLSHIDEVIESINAIENE